MKQLVPLLVVLFLWGHSSCADGAEEASGESRDKPSSAGKGEQLGEDGETKSRKEMAEGHSYCEYDNCYELLGVETDAGPIPIKRAYRRLASQWHPDRCPGGDYAKCKEWFPRYANAYEVLSTPEMRKNYDYVLANPYEFPGFYMKYSRPRYAPKSDLRFVLVLTLLAATAVHYFLKHAIYEQALATVKKDPRMRYHERLKEILARQSAKSPKKTAKGDEADKRKKAAEAELALELAAEMPPPPVLADTIAVQVFKAPLTLVYTLLWALGGGMREPEYMTRKALGLSAAEWESMDDAERQSFLQMELWVADKLAAYNEEIASDEKSGKVKSGKEKRAERQQKKGKGSFKMDD